MSHLVLLARTRARHRFAVVLAALLTALVGLAPPALAERSTLSSGAGETCAVTVPDGVSCWGADVPGSFLKAPAGILTKVPTDVPQAAPAKSVDAGDQAYKCELRANGSVGCWGWSWYFDQDYWPTSTVPPVQLIASPASPSTPSTDFVDVAVNDREGCGVQTNGRIRCWRAGSTASDEILGVVDATSITSAGEAFCVARVSGGVACFDRGLSRGTGIMNGPVPTWTKGAVATNVPGVSGAVTVSGTCALLASGKVTCWSISHRPQKDEEYVSFTDPVEVAGLTGVVDLAVGTQHACAVVDGGDVLCWGSNASGQLGLVGGGSSSTPVHPRNLGAATDVSVTNASSCARLTDGSVRCWGDPAFLGLANPTPAPATPYEPDGGLSVVASTEPRPDLDPQRPSAPLPSSVGGGFGDVTATAIVVRWEPPLTIPASGLREYVVQLGGQEARVPSTDRAHQFRGLTPATNYTATVVAVDNGGNESEPLTIQYRTQADLKIGPPVFGEPQVGPDSITLPWEPSGTLPPVNFRVQGAGKDVLVPGGTRSYTFTGLEPGTAYPITVTALDGEGQQSAGASVTITTAPREEPPPTPIPEIEKRSFKIAGTTTIPTLSRAPLPLTGTAKLTYDYSTNAVPGELAINDTQARVNALGFIPITATIGFVTSAPVAGTRTSAGLSLSTKLRIKVRSVKAFGAIPLAGGNSCQTRQLSTMEFASPAGFAILGNGGTLIAGYAISDLNGCGILNGLVSPLVAGTNNTMALTLTPAA